jgi:tetratricopeptide (TPR) repeat protein
MAARVNVKFVIALAAIVAVVFVGTAGIFAFVKLRSGDRYLRLGDQAMARGDFNAADTFYARAVGKDSGNPEWLARWRTARESKTPETATAYQQDFSMYVNGILRSLATSQRTNVEAHSEYLEAILEQLLLGTGREGWEWLIKETEASLAYFPTDEKPAALRRYRGIALAYQFSLDPKRNFTAKELQDLEMGREDLEAALALDATDIHAARELAGWHRSEATRLDDPNRGVKENARILDPHYESSHRILAEFLRANPGHPLGLIDQLALDADDVNKLEDRAGRREETNSLRIEGLNRLKSRLDEVEQHLLACEPARLDFHTLIRFFNVAIRIDPQAGAAAVLAVADHAITGNPHAADLRTVRANTLMASGKLDEAIQEFGFIAELPNLPMSLQGLRLWDLRRIARFHQTNTSMTATMQARKMEERERALERAREFRRNLTQHFAERSPEILFIDGKLLYVERDLSGAQRSLAEFIRSPGSASAQAPEALLMLADCAMQRGAPGLAREYMQQLQALRPDSTEVRLTLASLYVQLQNHDEAERIYTQVLEQDPKNTHARTELESLLALRRAGTASDPVIQAIIEAERLSRGDKDRLGDDAAAIRHLQKALVDHSHDHRIFLALAQLHVMIGDSEGAEVVMIEAEKRHPDNPQIQEIRQALQVSESEDLMLAMIDESSRPELEKWLDRHRIYTLQGRQEEATAAFARAAALAPDDPRIVDLQFVTAIRANNLTEASALADRAARLDLDRADGDTFRARLQIAQGNPEQAVITLQRAADRGNATSQIFRLLGLMQLQLPNRNADAIASLNRSLEMNPGDPETIKALIDALWKSGRHQEALAVARKSEVYIRRDADLVNLWLALEAGAGNTRFARERREQILARNPADRNNVGALAELYISEREFEKARKLIDLLRENLTTVIVALDARWHADRGDLERAYQVFVDYIDSLKRSGQPVGAEPYMVFGQFLFQRGQIKLGLDAMNEAARFQDPKTRGVDILIAGILLEAGRPDEAEKRYREVIAAGVADPALRKQLIRSLLAQNRFEEADREFGALGAAVNTDLELLLLRAAAARGMGDTRRAREVLDLAVTRFPRDPQGYFQRAYLLMASPASSSDAMADLATALRLQPGMVQAHRLRALVHLAAGQTDEALRELVAAVNANPTLDFLRFETIKRLLLHDRETQAVELAAAAVTLRPSDAGLQSQLGDAFAQAARWSAASRFYGQAWQIVGTEAAALPYIRALVRAAPAGTANAPQYADAIRVLRTASLNTNESIDLLMARAALHHKQGRADLARADALQAHSLVKENPRLLMESWFEQLRRIYTDPAAALAVLAATRPSATIEPWHGMVRARILISDSATRSEGISVLRAISAEGTNVALRLNALQALSSELAKDEKWQEAFDATLQGLDLVPNDAMLNNNAAFYLMDKLDRAAEGLSYAEKAAAVEPNHRIILDTLASAQWKAGQRENAIQTLSQALRVSRTAADRASTALKLSRWQLENGDRNGARGTAQHAWELIAGLPDGDRELQTTLNQLLQDIEQGR